ncbi:acyl-[acyl-carrier-protein] thioesterase [Flavobacterium agricola]|uniref:Acyl-[acyl-carrier-protein] thioesterase n=1 Tax=Flavobacterium agricola TaxID=2870839 RepID=A0ABY6M258_9FLAO|nr:acyl-ACP thioesterase domain-containing protein [Flavobacterium agricola]UYW01857.1 acyl-[acyl-carrier-protein] thioesterase [Flavobacterium agricola]
MPISPNFQSIFSLNWEINFTQCAANGKLKYTDMNHLFQLTASAHSDSGGMSFADMQANKQAWVVSRMYIEVIEMPKWGDEVTITTWIEYLDNGRSIRAIEMYLGDKKLAGATSLWVVLDTERRKAADQLAINSGHLIRYPDRKPTSKEASRINYAEPTQLVEQRQVRLSDLDIVNHVNNVKYVEWCLDVFDVDLIVNEQIKSLNLNYLRELNLNEQVEIKKTQVNNHILFTIEKNKKVCFCMEVELK